MNQVICMGCGTRLQGAPAAAGGGSKKALLISLGVAGVIALAAGSYFLFFSGDGSKEEKETAAETDNPKTPEKLAELAFNAIAKNDNAAFVKLHAVSKKKEEPLEIILEDRYPIDDEAIKKYAEHEEITEEEAKKEIKDRRARFSERTKEASDKRFDDGLKREKKRVQEAFEKVVAELKDQDIDWSKAELLRVDKKHTKIGQIERGDLFIVFLHNDEEFTIRLERCMSLGLDGWVVIIGPRLVSSG